jgi:WD40-like Beta Propeller Repeat
VSRRLLVVVSFLLVFGATAAVRTGERAPQPTTVAKVRGSIEALAQDGRRIAWMETNASCGKQVQILTLPRRHPVYVGSSQGKSCRLRGRTFGAIALTADGRVLWQGLAGFGNTEFDYDVFTAALRAPRTRLVAAFALSYDAGDPDDYFRWGRPLPMAAHGTTAVFFGHQDIGGYKGIKPGIFRLVGGRSRHLADVTGPGGLAVSGGRFADVTNSPRCCNDTPVWSHDGTRLAWIYHGNLWTIHADGTRDRQLAAGAATPSWSPDDTQLVFEHRETSGARGIYRVNANGGGLLRLAAGSTPAWSPDGTRIAFVRGKDVYSIAPGGTAARKLTKTERPTSGPLSWSPDSTRIAVSRAGDIYTVRADGAGEVRLTTSQRPETPARVVTKRRRDRVRAGIDARSCQCRRHRPRPIDLDRQWPFARVVARVVARFLEDRLHAPCRRIPLDSERRRQRTAPARSREVGLAAVVARRSHDRRRRRFQRRSGR